MAMSKPNPSEATSRARALLDRVDVWAAGDEFHGVIDLVHDCANEVRVLLQRIETLETAAALAEQCSLSDDCRCAACRGERAEGRALALQNAAEEAKMEWYAAVRDMRRALDRAEQAERELEEAQANYARLAPAAIEQRERADRLERELEEARESERELLEAVEEARRRLDALDAERAESKRLREQLAALSAPPRRSTRG